MPAPRVVVVGGGVSGLTAAYEILRRRGDADVVVLEAAERVGGTATTDAVPGPGGDFEIDRGPNGFLTNVPDSIALVHELGLDAELQPASDAATYRFLYAKGRLEPAPTGAGAMLRSRLVSTPAKLRLVLEPFLPRGDPAVDESVHAFASRRLGPAFADAFVAPMVAGVSAGDAREVSLAAQFPRMHALEAEHGSLVRGMLAQQRARRAAKRAGRAVGPSGGPSGPGGRLTSFRHGGAGRLSEALAGRLGERVRTGAAAVGLERTGQGMGVRLAGGEELVADRVVLATPAFVSAELLGALAPAAADGLRSIPYAGVRVVALAYPRASVAHPLDGFGFLVLPGEDVRALGVLWTSTLFPQQAPEGQVLLRLLGGGRRDPAFLDLSEEEAVVSARADLRRSMGIDAEPSLTHVITWRRGIPQYTLGHRDRVAAVFDALRALPAVSLTGNAYHGVGLNDCVRDARAVGERVAAGLA